MDRLDHFEGADVFFRSPDPEYRWLVPGLLERGDRLLITGNEGKGKSTLLRQFAAQISLGIHPVTLLPFDPPKVALLDLENSAVQIRRQVHRLMPRWESFKGDSFRVSVRLNGMDLLRDVEQRDLIRILDAFKPDL